MQQAVLVLVVGVQGFGLGGLHFAVVLEDGDGEAHDDAVERMTRVGVAAVAHLQSGQPSLSADGYLPACGLAVAAQSLQVGVGGYQFLAGLFEVERQSGLGELVQPDGLPPLVVSLCVSGFPPFRLVSSRNLLFKAIRLVRASVRTFSSSMRALLRASTLASPVSSRSS